MTPRQPHFRRGFRTLATLLATATLALANGPQLSVQGPRGEQAPLAIESIEADVLIIADIAETILTITFRNPGDSVTEGEFAIPLPSGSTISSYALDVNGAMREGVIVEKERARFAYESIKRKMIDPGFVEREAGNVYRTKIFPIPAKGTKAVRIGYCEFLDSKDDKLSYSLPLPEGTESKLVRFQIRHADERELTFTSDGNLRFEHSRRDQWLATLASGPLGKEISLTWDDTAQPRLLTNGQKFYLRSPRKHTPDTAKPLTPKSLDLVWDCSESGNSRNHEKEFTFLDLLFAQYQTLPVKLTLLGSTIEEGGTFQVKQGDWSTLRTKLEKTTYDGSTNLAAFTPSSDLTLLVSDGRDLVHTLAAPWQQPVALLDSTGTASAYWINSAKTYLDLSRIDPAPSVKSLTHPAPKIISFGNQHETDFLSTFSANFERTLGIWDQADPPSLTFTYSSSHPPIEVKAHPISDLRLAKMIDRMWAQQKLLELEAQPVRDNKAILKHCQEHTLVSDETSLIVLDRFEDYVRYRIPPPEPDLLVKYEREIKTKDIEASLRNALIDRWKHRKSWHSKSFPWQDYIFLLPIQQIPIWEKALNTAFQKEDLDQQSVGTILLWKTQALDLMKQRTSLSNQAEFKAWQKELARLVEQEQQLRNLPITPPAKDEPLAISVRGLVNNPGTIHSKEPLTLLKAVNQAGGINSFGYPGAVAIYRNATKTLYNTLSKEFQDISLLPGDLIVVQDEYSIGRYDYSDSDPFGGPSEPIDPSTLPAVVPGPTNLTDALIITLGGGPFGNPDGPLPNRNDLVSTLVLPETTETNDEKLAKFEQALIAGASPTQEYRKLRGTARNAESFYILTSEILRNHGHLDLSHRVLSNLLEEEPLRPANFRMCAYLHARHGEWTLAADLLQTIARHFPDDQLLALDQGWLATHLDDADSNKHWLRASQLSLDSTQGDETLAEIAAAELNATEAGRALLPKGDFAKVLDLDLRIVLSNCTGKTLQYQLIEPTGSTLYFPQWPRDAMFSGARSQSEKGFGEFIINDAIPGTYEISCQPEGFQVIRMQIYRNWGRKEMTVEEHILTPSLEKGRQHLATYELTFGE